jgi:hypothetical protein
MSLYEAGDYIKVEFPDEATGVSEWMWVRVQRCDDGQKIVFGAWTTCLSMMRAVS